MNHRFPSYRIETCPNCGVRNAIGKKAITVDKEYIYVFDCINCGKKSWRMIKEHDIDSHEFKVSM